MCSPRGKQPGINSFTHEPFLFHFDSRADGYITRFGVTYIDYTTQARYPKESGKFVSQVRVLLVVGD